MNTPHKWAKEIKAWADGECIQERRMSNGEWKEWKDITSPTPIWWTDYCYEFRIKPAECHEASQPKEPQYLYVFFNEQSQKIDFDVINCDLDWLKYIGKIKLEQEE